MSSGAGRTPAGSLAPLVPKRSGHRLWYDDRDIPFLCEDATNEADILNTLMTATRTGVDGGFDPERYGGSSQGA